MTITTTSGCAIMRCTSYKEGVCHYSATWCKYSHEATQSRYAIAVESLERISDRYYDNPGDPEEAASDMRDIADSTLRRLMLDNPHRDPNERQPFPEYLKGG